MAAMEVAASVLAGIALEAAKTVAYVGLFAWAFMFSLMLSSVSAPAPDPGNPPPAVYYQHEDYENETRSEPLSL